MIMNLISRFYQMFLNDRFLSFLIQSILICSLTMSLIAGILLLITRCLKDRQSAAGRCLLWWITGIGFLIPFKPHPAGAAAVIHERFNDATVLSDAISDRLRIGVYLSKEFFLLLLFVWMTGAVIYGAVTLNRQEQFSRSIICLRTPADAGTQHLANKLCTQLGLAQNVPVYTVPVIDTPMLTGLLNPCILLPEQNFDPAELRLILKHEICHYRRGDLFCKLLWICCRVIHWFNPLLPILMRQMERDCELACDEAVMKNESTDSAHIYCNSIMHTAMRRAAGNSGTMLATGFACSREMLRNRMQAILSGEKKQRCMAVAAAAVILTAMTGSILAYAADESHPRQYPENLQPDVVMTTCTMPEEMYPPTTYTMPVQTFSEYSEPITTPVPKPVYEENTEYSVPQMIP